MSKKIRKVFDNPGKGCLIIEAEFDETVLDVTNYKDFTVISWSSKTREYVDITNPLTEANVLEHLVDSIDWKEIYFNSKK